MKVSRTGLPAVGCGRVPSINAAAYAAVHFYSHEGEIILHEAVVEICRVLCGISVEMLINEGRVSPL